MKKLKFGWKNNYYFGLKLEFMCTKIMQVLKMLSGKENE